MALSTCPPALRVATPLASASKTGMSASQRAGKSFRQRASSSEALSGRALRRRRGACATHLEAGGRALVRDACAATPRQERETGVSRANPVALGGGHALFAQRRTMRLVAVLFG